MKRLTSAKFTDEDKKYIQSWMQRNVKSGTEEEKAERVQYLYQLAVNPGSLTEYRPLSDLLNFDPV